jgi:hypothetical protein
VSVITPPSAAPGAGVRRTWLILSMGSLDPGGPRSSKGTTGGLILVGQDTAEGQDDDEEDEDKHNHGGKQGNRVYKHMHCPSGKRNVCICVVYIYNWFPGETGIGGPG